MKCPADGDGDLVILEPRQVLAAVPLALSLRPGASVVGNGTPLTLQNTSSSGYGLYVSNLSISNAALYANNNSSSGTAAEIYKYGGAGVSMFARNVGSSGYQVPRVTAKTGMAFMVIRVPAVITMVSTARIISIRAI